MDKIQNDYNQTNVGKKLTDKNTQKVIICVFLMIFIAPVFRVETYINEPDSLRYGMDLFHSLSERKAN